MAILWRSESPDPAQYTRARQCSAANRWQLHIASGALQSFDLPQKKQAEPWPALSAELPMTRVDDRSSWLLAHGHHPETRTLRVTLRGGAVYEYRDTDPFRPHANDSVGRQFLAHIKGKVHRRVS